MLRVGIMLDSFVASAWVAQIVEDIQASDFSRIETIILVSDPPPNTSVRTHNSRRKFSLYKLYEQWDYTRSKANSDALAATDLSSLLNGLPRISLSLATQSSPHTPESPELARLRSYNLDLVLNFRADRKCGPIPTVVRNGVWSLYPDTSTHTDSGYPLVWEMFDQADHATSLLQIALAPPVAFRIIPLSYSAIDHTSLHRTRNPIYWKNAEILLRYLRDLSRHGFDYLLFSHGNSDALGLSSEKQSAPGNIPGLTFLLRHLSRSIKARTGKLDSGALVKWGIAIRPRTSSHSFDDSSGYNIMPCDKSRFYADPFLLEKDGQTFLFFEDYPYAEQRGIISCCTLDAEGIPGLPFEVLRRPYHLSYPHIFEEAGEVYMIPETKENRTVELYRATHFPFQWVLEAILLSDVYAVDATIHQQGGKFWMFAGVSNGKYSNCDELAIFFADSLKGPWIPHPQNPVLSDVRRARPAGPIFRDNGRLIRPSQDCGKAYGYALVFSEILTLTETEYAERPIGRLEPNLVPQQIGNHTYGRTDRFEVIDINAPQKFQPQPHEASISTKRQ